MADTAIASPPSPVEMLMQQAERLRTRAHELETLARNLAELHLGPKTMNALGELMAPGLYR